MGSSSVTPFPVLEDVTIAYPPSVYETNNSAGGKILRTPLEPAYITQPHVQEFNNGFYSTSPTSPVPNTGSPRKSRLFQVDESKTYLLTATTLTTSAAVYYDVNMVVLGSEYPSGTGYTDRVRVPLTFPSGTKYVGSSAAAARSYPELEEVVQVYRSDPAFRGNSNKTIEQLDKEKTDEIDSQGRKVVRNGLSYKYTAVTPVSSESGGFYTTSGTYSTSASRRTNMFPVTPGKNYVISGSVINPTYLVIYYSGTPTALPGTAGLTALGGQQFNVSGVYDRQVLTVPAGTTYIGSNTGGGAILEEQEIYYREDIAYTGGSTKTIKDLEDALGTGIMPGLSVGYIGDSMTAFPDAYPPQLAKVLNITNAHNVAAPGARMSKTRQFSSEYAVAPTQNYDDPDYLGVTSTSPNPSMTVDQLKKCANNCGPVQVQRFISEVNAGLFPVPDVVIIGLGTNADYGGTYGSISTALTGKTMHRDSTFNFANALRYVIQELKTAYPECLVVVRTIVQRANPSYNATFSVPKNEIIRGVANGMSTAVADMYNESGISEKNEVEGGNGLDLKDGLHHNSHGAIRDARFIGNFIWSRLSLKHKP